MRVVPSKFSADGCLVTADSNCDEFLLQANLSKHVDSLSLRVRKMSHTVGGEWDGSPFSPTVLECQILSEGVFSMHFRVEFGPYRR